MLFVQMFFGKYQRWKFGKFSIVSFWNCRKETYSQVINKCFHMLISICNIIVETVHAQTCTQMWMIISCRCEIEKCWITDQLCGLHLINFDLSWIQILYNEEINEVPEISYSHFIIHALENNFNLDFFWLTKLRRLFCATWLTFKKKIACYYYTLMIILI